MYQSHGIGYEEYSRKLSQRLKIEQKRQIEYEQSLKIVANFERRGHYTI